MNHTFTLDHDDLFEVTQYISYLYNKILSEPDRFRYQTGFNSVTFDLFKELWIEDLNAYKVYDCWLTPTSHNPLAI